MRELAPNNILDYVRSRRLIPHGTAARAELLGWGVSNVVFRVESAAGPQFVLKQSREKLRTAAEWISRPERIFREADVQRVLGGLLPAGVVPRVLFEDSENYLYTMEAVDADHRVWKQALLDGEADESIARRAGETLAAIHSRTADDAALRSRWDDLTVFDELRLDPFYRFTAGPHPQLQPHFEELIQRTLRNRHCLVLGDFSPKNILLTRQGVSLVDFETGHFGDPAFDLGFFLSHLLLKAIRREKNPEPFLRLAEVFWGTYGSQLQPADCAGLQLDALAERATPHLAGCLLARIDGKSPVDYLDERGREAARQFAVASLRNPPRRPEEVFADLRRTLSR